MANGSPGLEGPARGIGGVGLSSAAELLIIPSQGSVSIRSRLQRRSNA